MPSPPSPARVVRLARWALAAYGAVLGLMLLAPSPAAPSWLIVTVTGWVTRAGVPETLATTDRVEFLLNVAAFVPLAALGGLIWRRLTWRDWTAFGFVASFGVEVVQALGLDARSATHVDVVANTLGALLGAAVAAVAVRLLPGSTTTD